MSKLSDQIRQEYREAVACAVEGKDDIQAWGKVYQSLSKAIFSAWLSSVADNTEGIEECEVAKLIFAKSDCGAGKEGSGGFQPGNTCAGEGGTSEDKPKPFLHKPTKKLAKMYGAEQVFHDSPGGGWEKEEKERVLASDVETREYEFQDDFRKKYYPELSEEERHKKIVRGLSGRRMGAPTLVLRNISVNPNILEFVNGLNNEKRELSSPRTQVLVDSMKKDGWKEDSYIYIAVLSDGDVRIMEGNHRKVASLEAGLDNVNLEVKYHLGAEKLDPEEYSDEIFHPENLYEYIEQLRSKDKSEHKKKFASDCGAGKDTAPGFQPGNTCAGEGGGATSTTAIDNHDYKAEDYRNRYRLSKQLSEIVLDNDAKSPITNKVESGTILAVHESLKDLANFNLKDLSGWYGEHYQPDAKRIYKTGNKSDLASTELYEFVKSYVKMSEEEQIENQNKLVKKADDFVCSVFLDGVNIGYDSESGVGDYEYTNKSGEKSGIAMTSKTKVFEDVEEFIDDRFTLRDADKAEIRVLTEFGEELDGTVKSGKVKESWKHKTKNFLDALSDVKKILKEKNIQIPNLEIHLATQPFEKHTSLAIFTNPGRGLTEFKSPLSFNLGDMAWENSGRIMGSTEFEDDDGNEVEQFKFVAGRLEKEDALRQVILHEIGHQLHHTNLAFDSIKRRHKTPDSVENLIKHHKEGRLTRGTKSGEELMYRTSRFLSDLEITHAQYEQKPWDIAKFEEGLDIYDGGDWFRYINANVSNYASINHSEFVAEVFSGLSLGLEFDNLIMKMYENLGGPLVG